jgi:dihydroorotate dehydrogenase (fumarate)/dihydroorotate dehydrogenase
MYRSLLRPLLFRGDPERVHHAALATLAWLGRARGGRAFLKRYQPPDCQSLRCDLAGLPLAHPLGLAAGWDKNGIAIPAARALGFAAVEIGSISARPSPGNRGRRLWRLPTDEAILVNYGLPNEGAAAIAARLGHRAPDASPREVPTAPLGINLVATNDEQTRCGSIAEMITDYRTSTRLLAPLADYLTLNLSCPNTGSASDPFSQSAPLRDLLEATVEVCQDKPLFLKITADPDPATIDFWLEQTAGWTAVRGFVFNLPRGQPTAMRTPAKARAGLPGAVSGPPVRDRMLRCVRTMARRQPPGRFQIIGGGGISTADHAYEYLRAGASALQLYTALIYRGPSLLAEITCGLRALLERDGFGNVTEAVGSAL